MLCMRTRRGWKYIQGGRCFGDTEAGGVGSASGGVEVGVGGHE